MCGLESPLKYSLPRYAKAATAPACGGETSVKVEVLTEARLPLEPEAQSSGTSEAGSQLEPAEQLEGLRPILVVNEADKPPNQSK